MMKPNEFNNKSSISDIRVAVNPNTAYTVSTDVTPCNYFTVTFYASMDDVGTPTKAISYIETANINSKSFTTPDGCYCVAVTACSDTESEFVWNWWQLEAGSTASAYEPYNGQTLTLSTPNGLPGIPVTSGGNYTDSTGKQWLCDEVDFEKGVYVQRFKKVVFDGSVDENWEATLTNTSGVHRMQSGSLITTIKPVENSYVVGNIICSAFTAITAVNTWARKTGISVDVNKKIQCYSDAYTTYDASIWKSYLADNPMTVIYELAVPIETPLSAEELAAYATLHTNYPNTTVYNDEGAGMEVKYVADTKLYVDKKFAELSAALLNQ